MTGNNITGTANAGVRVLIFDNTTDFDLTFTGNTIGTIASPVGTNVQEAVEIRVGDVAGGATGPSRMDALIDNNSIVNSGGDQPMDIDAEDNGDVNATVTNNVFRNVGSATQSFAATSEQAGTTFCLDLRSNEAYLGAGTTPGAYFVTESAGVFTANETTGPAMTAAQITGSATLGAGIGAVVSCTLPAP
jgi:hypothetical protein